jgi:alpha-glucosidase
MAVLDDQGQATGTLYEDAGDGYDYLQGEYCLAAFSAQKDGHRVVVKCTQQQGDLASQSRLVTVMVVDEKGTHYGFGDICSPTGVRVMLNLSTE